MNDRRALVKFLKESLGLSDHMSFEIHPLSVRGSDRTFYRIKWAEDKRAILVHYDPIRQENIYYAEIGRFLKDLNVYVPEVYAHDPVGHFILLEDLGDSDLYSLRNESWNTRKALYEKTLENILKLHTYPVTDFLNQKVRTMDGFDASLYRWEHDYFMDHFVIGLCEFKQERFNMKGLKGELDILIEVLLNSRQSLIHRDFQSQNVIIKDDLPYLIDFQGMRIGNPLYDLASVLNDPYVIFSNEERLYLVEFYYKNSCESIQMESFMELFWCASCQRLMQALGAYGYLGLKKGIKSFLNHIPSGIKNLKDSIFHISFMPNLFEIVNACHEIVKSKKIQK
ncbi:MAG: phosphotransferase [Syntrophorhabdaceae bacterium]|nr:phosphotransferase [Syntrophorhabdaceae bacterium]